MGAGDSPERPASPNKFREGAATCAGLNEVERDHEYVAEIGAKPLPQDTHTCWSCGSMRAAHFCASCGKVQPPVPVDYFTFFGLPPKLNLDVSALEKDLYVLSRKLVTSPSLPSNAAGFWFSVTGH